MNYLWSGRDLNIFTWILVAVSFFPLCIRIYVNARGLRKVAWYRDVMVFFAWVFFVAYSASFSIMIGKSYWDYDWDVYIARGKATWEYAGIFSWVSGVVYVPILWLIKADLLFLYHELAPRAHNPKMFWAIMVGWFLTITGFFLMQFWFLFQCMPNIADYWIIIDDDAGTSDCSNPEQMYLASWVMIILSDVLIYCIPVVIIYRQKMLPLKEKLSAGLMFFIGFINIAGAGFCMAGLMILNITYAEEDWGWQWTGVGFFMYVMQAATAIWIVCMPHCRSMWRLIRGTTPKGASDVEKASPSAEGSSGQPSPTESVERSGSVSSRGLVSPGEPPAQASKPIKSVRVRVLGW